MFSIGMMSGPRIRSSVRNVAHEIRAHPISAGPGLAPDVARTLDDR